MSKKLQELKARVKQLEAFKKDSPLPNVKETLAQIDGIYGQIAKIQEEVDKKAGDLLEELSVLKKQSQVFERQLIPVLKDVKGHLLKGKNVLVELQSGRRSPKVGYEYLVGKVAAKLVKAAEEAMASAAEFAQMPKVTLVSGSVLDWFKDVFSKLTSFVKGLFSSEKKLSQAVKELESVVE